MNRFQMTLLGIGTILILMPSAGCGSTGSMGDVITLSRAEQNLLEKDYAEARQLAQGVLARGGNNKRALLALAWSEYGLGNYRTALSAFQRAEAVDRRDYQVQSGIGWARFKMGDLAAAEARFRALSAQPLTFWQRWEVNDGLGWISYATGDFQQAEKYFRFEPHPQIHEDPVDWGRQKDSLVGRGLIALNRSRLARARELFAEGVSADPGYFRHYDGLARTALLEGRYADALEQALKGLDLVGYDQGLVLVLDAILEKLASPEKSVKTYEGLIARHPEAGGYHAFLGRAQLKLGRLTDAEASFVKALAYKPDDSGVRDDLARTRRRMDDLVAHAWRQYFDGDYEAALAAFEAKRPEARRSRNPAAETGIGWALLSLGRTSEAMPAFRAALRIDPNFEIARQGIEALAEAYRTHYLQAWALAEAGKFERAERQFLRAREHAPAAFQWKVDDGLAWLLLYRRHVKDAEAAFRRILRKFPDAYLSRKGLGYAALERGDYAAAAKHLFASFAQEPKQVLTSYTFPALRLLEKGQFETARKLLELGLGVYPDSADIQFLLAKAYKGLDDAAMAVKMAMRAVVRAPTYIHPAFDDLGLDPAMAKDAYLEMARGLFRRGDNAGAIQRVDDYLRAGGKDPRGVRIRGFALFRQGRYREANLDLETAAAREPDNLPPVTEMVPIPGADAPWTITYNARSTLAWSHLRLGEFRQAAATFRAVVKAHPMWIDALTGLGYSLLALGNTEDAVRYFRRALVVSPGYPDAWQGLDLAKAAR